MILFLAWRNLLRQRARTVLCVLGLAVSTALLYDMALLSTGLRSSLERVLAEIGYELRVLPKGGLPFSSDAALPHGQALADDLAHVPGVAQAVPLWATTLQLSRATGAASARPVAAFALGIDPARQTIYRVVAGPGLANESADLPANAAIPIVLNARLADTLRVAVGDTLIASVGLDAAGGGAARPALGIVRGIAEFRLDTRAQRSAALALGDLQRLAGRAEEDPASFVLGKLAPGADAARAVAAFRARHPDADVYSVAELLSQVRGQLSYFQQFSLILGTVSLLVTFLLVLTLLTLSVNERQGEFAILRALGLKAHRVVALVVAEGLALAVFAIAPGITLGAAASTGLDAILKGSPGLPADLSFFVFTPAALTRTAVLVLVTSTLAGAYPAWIAARTNVVLTLHREVT